MVQTLIQMILIQRPFNFQLKHISNENSGVRYESTVHLVAQKSRDTKVSSAKESKPLKDLQIIISVIGNHQIEAELGGFQDRQTVADRISMKASIVHLI